MLGERTLKSDLVDVWLALAWGRAAGEMSKKNIFLSTFTITLIRVVATSSRFLIHRDSSIRQTCPRKAFE